MIENLYIIIYSIKNTIMLRSGGNVIGIKLLTSRHYIGTLKMCCVYI